MVDSFPKNSLRTHTCQALLVGPFVKQSLKALAFPNRIRKRKKNQAGWFSYLPGQAQS